MVKNDIKPSELELKVQIEDAVSKGNAYTGHDKYTAISGKIIKGKTEYYSFDIARRSGGGFLRGVTGSCTVLERTVQTIGKDVSLWLTHPFDEARMGDIYLIK